MVTYFSIIDELINQKSDSDGTADSTTSNIVQKTTWFTNWQDRLTYPIYVGAISISHNPAKPIK